MTKAMMSPEFKIGLLGMQHVFPGDIVLNGHGHRILLVIKVERKFKKSIDKNNLDKIKVFFLSDNCRIDSYEYSNLNRNRNIELKIRFIELQVALYPDDPRISLFISLFRSKGDTIEHT